MGVGTDFWEGVNLRCLMAEMKCPKDEPPEIWRSHQWFYDVGADEFLFCDVAVVLRFDIRLGTVISDT